MTMLMTSMLGFAACSSDGASKEAADVSANDDVPTDFQIQYTTAVPSEFFQTATRQGTIELVECVVCRGHRGRAHRPDPQPGTGDGKVH